jgi:glycosyltransferase involved in cell wall biosynthesis
MTKAFIIFTHDWPHNGGGGRGIAYRMLETLSVKFPRLDDCDMYCMFGLGLTQLRSAEDAARLLAQPPQAWPAVHPKILGRPAKWYKQTQIIASVASQHESTVLLAHEYLFAGRLASRDRLSILQVEHSKGGVHAELLAANHRKDMKYQFVKLLVHQAMGTADRIVFPSQGAADLYASNNPGNDVRDKTAIVYNGVPDPLKRCEVGNSGIADGTLTIVNVANHVSEKSIDLAIEGTALWKERSKANLKLRFINFGQAGSETEKLNALVTQRGLQEEVSFRGFTPRAEVLNAMAQADIFALTPQVAVFDLALLEAMGLMKPILSTPVGGNLEALGTDYRCYARNPAEFAERLEKLVTDQDFAATVGKANRERFLERFTDQAMIDNYLALVTETLDAVDQRTRSATA